MRSHSATERPHAPVHELEVVEDLDVPLDLERVAADEQVLVAAAVSIASPDPTPS